MTRNFPVTQLLSVRNQDWISLHISHAVITYIPSIYTLYIATEVLMRITKLYIWSYPKMNSSVEEDSIIT